MPSDYERSDREQIQKAVWVKPTVRHLKAGAAEINDGTRDDGDNGTALNNS